MSQPNLTEDLNVIANSNIEITLLDGDLNIIQKLDDEPNDVGGLTAAELKAKFDEAGNTIKTYINDTLIPEILTEEATEAARAAAEESRVTAEAERQSAEEARASAEATRQSNEENRESNEAARVAAEALRVSAETAREQAESGRVTAEEARSTAESLRASAEEQRASAEQARDTAEQNRADAEENRVNAEQNRATAEQNRAAAETARASAETARDAAEQERVAADIQRTENAEQVIRDSARNAYLSKSYASGQYTISESFDIEAGRTLGSMSAIHHDPYVEVGRRYLVTVNDESAEVVATYNGISVFGINIRNNNSNGYDVKNNNDYDVTGSFESIDEAIVGKTAKEYVNEAERQAKKAAAYVNGGRYLDAAQDGSILPAVVAFGAKDYADRAKVYAEGGAFDPYPHDPLTDTERHDGAKNLADKAKAFAEGGDYLEWEYLGSGRFSQETKTVEKGAKQYAEAAAGSAAAASASEINAKASETAAKESETTAKSEADRAKSEADRAAGIVGGDYATKTDLSAHTDDTDIHVTTEEKAAWNAKADAPKSVSVTLAAASWDSTAKTQTVTVTGVSANETAQMITPVPAMASQSAYYDASIKCTGQAADSLTFTADTIPTADLTVYVVIQEVRA